MKNKYFSLALIFGLSINSLHAQKDTAFWNKDMFKIATPTSKAGWINIKPGVHIIPSTFFDSERKALGLGSYDKMQFVKTMTDHLGMTHARYQQYYKGYKVIYAEYYLHSRHEQLITANGKMIRGLNKGPVINISKGAALKNALKYLPAPKYAWEIPQLENNYKEILHNQNATYKPIGELVWVTPDETANEKKSANYELAFMFDIYPASLYGKRIFVSARNGIVIKSIPLTPNCDATSVTTNFYGSQSFSTKLIAGSSPARWNLWNDCRPAFIHVQKWASSAPFAEYTSSAGNNWSSNPSEATSLWCMEKTYDYYFNTYSRDGWNGAGGGVFILQDAIFQFPCNPPPGTCSDGKNAKFSNGTMLIGNSDNLNTIDDWNTLDLVAHEFTHGVTASSCNLAYNKESGALNESFSDILGVSCHAWLFGLSGNTWLVGFDRKNPNNTAQSLYLRNMANPNDKSQPDTYKSEPLWYNTDSTNAGNDFWGVHTNSGVQNYMYYLLTAGGSGTNDNSVPYSVLGIGMVYSQEIAYRALTVGYLTPTSGFAEARNAWVHAAVDIYGECSIQAIETGKAWEAVGIPPPEIDAYTNYCSTFGSSSSYIVEPNVITLSLGCTLNVIPSSEVHFGARKVILEPGFHAQAGSFFKAYVSDCRYAAY